MMEGHIPYEGNQIYYKHIFTNINAPTIIFLHDSLGCVQLWRDFPLKHQELTQCNIFIYDRIGYGKSSAMHSTILTNNYMHIEAEILNFIIHEKEIHNPILFGHSDGGNIALLSAAINKNILGVICEAGHIYVEEITLQGILKSIDIYKYTDLKLKLEKYHAEKVECIFKAWTNIWLDEKFRYWNIINEIKNIECPLLFIQGEDDEYGSLQQVLDTMLHVKGERNCYILPHTKHTPHKEAAQKVLVQSSQFINSII